MKVIFAIAGLVCAAPMLASPTPAHAGTMDEAFGNTMTTSDAEGNTESWYFNPDGTLTMRYGKGPLIPGTWSLKGENICVLYEGRPELCYKHAEGKKVGDQWVSTGQSGSDEIVGKIWIVGLRAGRP